MRQIYEVASDIQREWKKVNYAAEPYLRAMHSLNDKNSTFGYDSAKSIVNYFLSNASQFKGEKARDLKNELKAIIK